MTNKKKNENNGKVKITIQDHSLGKQLLPIFEEEEQVQIRATYYNEEWYLCLYDVIVTLTNSTDPAQYWKKMKSRAKTEEWTTSINEVVLLPIPDQNGRLQPTNCANRKTLLRLVQAIPGGKAEKFKLWLAEVGDAVLSYVEDKTTAIEKWRGKWRKEGRDEEWIEARLKSDIIRNEWTTELQLRGIDDSRQYAYLTNKLHELTFDISIRDHKALKNIPARANLQDNSTPLELLIEATSQATATEIHRDRDSYGLTELDRDVVDASEVGKAARLAAERVMKKPVVNSQNYLKTKKQPMIDMPQNLSAKQEKKQKQLSLFDSIDANLPTEQTDKNRDQ